MARRYKVEGTKDFLYWAIALFALGVWAVKDGWFPSESVQRKHPLETVLSFDMDGVIEDVLVAPGQPVTEGQPLARLNTRALKAARDAAESAHEAAQARLREAGDDAGAGQERRAEAERAAAALQDARERLQAAELRSPASGEVLETPAVRGAFLETGATAVSIRPRTSFYIFNKSLAVLSFLGAIVCAIVHQFVK